MARYRKKPVVIEAERWRPGSFPDRGGTWEQLGVYHMSALSPDHPGWEIFAAMDPRPIAWGYVATPEGGHIVQPGDWIITGIQGERYPCKPDIFEATYEAVEGAPVG
jgi:hypothetical protein